MKKIIAAGVAAVSLLAAGSALAADLPARTYTKAPVVAAPVYNWTGFYINGGVGYGLADTERNVTNLAGLAYQVPQENGARGYLGRVGGGFDYQFLTSWVVGIQGDYTFSDIKGGPNLFTCPAGCPGPLVNYGSFKQDSSWAIGARLGYAWTPTFLTYFNAGYTQAHQDDEVFTTAAGVATGYVQPAHTLKGYYFGGGTEYALSWVPGLFARSEYRLSSYDTANTQGTLAGVPVATIFSDRTFTQTVVGSLVYRFNMGGGVVAKY